MGFLCTFYCIFISIFALSFSEDINCDHHCQKGSTINSTDCYSIVGCDLPFPKVSFSYVDLPIAVTLRLDWNFTELATTDASSGTPFIYSAIFNRYEYHMYDRYFFQIELSYWNSSGDFYNFWIWLRDIQPRDFGNHHVKLTCVDCHDGHVGLVLVQHIYRLLVYQPPSPLVCHGSPPSPSASYHFTINCSITDGIPPMNLDVIEQKGCNYHKHYTDNNGTKVLSVYVTSCEQNSTVGCIASSEPLDSVSTLKYSDRCEFNISRTYQVYQPPTPLVCHGSPPSPSASYHFTINCSITDGIPPMNLDVIEQKGCNYHKHYTDNNGTKVLSVYVTSCEQNSTVGCIASSEPLDSVSTLKYSDRCEFNISRTYQDNVGCSFHCIDGPNTKKSTDCYVIAGCDFTFPDVPILGNYKSSLSLSMNYSDDTRSDSPSRGIYKYNGKFWFRDVNTVDRYSFQVKLEYLWEDETPNDNLGRAAAALSFTIDDMRAEDAGSYHVTLTGETTEDALVQYNYHLFTIYQPSTPLLCEMQDLSTDSSISKLSITCSVPDAYPSVVLDMIEPKGCSYYKSYSQNDDIMKLTVYISTCDRNATFSCIATQGELEFMSTIPYSNSCSFNIPRDDPVISADTNNILMLVMFIIAGIIVLPVIIIVCVYKLRNLTQQKKRRKSSYEATIIKLKTLLDKKKEIVSLKE
ncbi:uncharacterized protein [Apostichopus japonicus]|uniref:uncharacterized protein isoform X2 n=1 Tax=Stichopus japonicus TaxID=307972 RepID=UPI003AB5678F